MLDRKGLTGFLAIAFGIAWLLAVPLWLDPRHLAAPWTKLVLMAMMFAPAIATFVVTRWVSVSTDLKKETGLILGQHWLRFWIFADLGILLFVVGALVVGWALGLLPADVTRSDAYKFIADAKPDLAQLISRWPRASIVVIVLLNAPVAPLVDGIFTFGEEWGWRGWLLPKLLPLGQWRALALSSAIWGIWHAPVIALGYNYPQHHALGLLLMIVFCVIIGIPLGWTRLATGSVWPAVIGHAVLNATAGAHALLGPEGSFDTAQATILGWSGWLLPLAFIAWLAATRRLPVATAF